MKKILTSILLLVSSIYTYAQVNPYPLVSIDSIQFVNSQKLSQGYTLPDYSNAKYGDTVQIEGIVSWDPHFYGLSKNRKSTFLQSANSSAWSGVEVMIDSSIFGKGAGNPTLKNLNNTTKFYDNFQPGLTVRCTGILKNFPASNSQTGHTQVMLLDYESIITNTSVTSITPAVLTIDKFMKNNGSGTQSVVPSSGEAYEGVYVEFKNVRVTDRSQGTGANSARWFWTVVDDFGNKIRIRDYSAYYRNDDNEDTYIANNYTAPATGTYLSYIRGVVIENITTSSGFIEYMLAPLMPNDVGPANPFIPPTIIFNSRNPMVPNSTQSVDIKANITDDSSVAMATLHYAVGLTNNTFTSVSMTNVGSIYTGTVPQQADGSYIKYWIEAEDNFGHKSYFPDTFGTNQDYMVIDAGITKISQIQNTPFSNGNSIFNGDTLSVDIAGVIVSTAVTSDLGIIHLQQGNAPYSGIALRQNVGDGLNQLKRGDSIRITRAMVREINGVTWLDSLRGNYTVVSSGNTLPAFVVGNIDSIAAKVYNYTEPWESMLMKFDTLYVVKVNADAPTGQFGEWAMYYSIGTGMPGIRVRGQSSDIGTTFNIDSLAQDQKMNFVQGVFSYSFSNWKLNPRNKKDLDLSSLPDKTPPVILLNGNWTDSLLLNMSYTDPGATASDDKDGNISSKIIRTGSIDSSKVGVYQLCYNVSDLAGNAAQQVCRNIIVYKNTGINSIQNQLTFAIYPNPSAGVFDLQLIQNKEKAFYTLTDVSGKIYMQKWMTQATEKIDVTTLAKGIYFVTVVSEGVSATKIITIQ
jgi:hypothetical protein